jgi:hypothetical protein
MNLDIDAFFADSYPIILSANVELEEGDNKQLDSQLLSNYFNTPMVIDEIRTQIVSPNMALRYSNFGGSVRLYLNMARYALMSEYVPVGCLGPTYEGGTIDNSTISPLLYSPESLYGGFVEDISTGFFRWKLPRPLVVPTGAALEAKISRSIEGLSNVYPDDTTLQVNVAYAGRVARKQLPEGVTVPIPYVGFFENVFTSASVAISDQLDLYNPFQVPLTVQRLIGRWQNIFLDNSPASSSGISLDWAGVPTLTQIDFPPTRIRTYDGFEITNGFAPGLSIWEGNTRTLPCNILFEPGQGLEITIDATGGIPSTTGSGSPYTGSNTSLITMIGWRNENL